MRSKKCPACKKGELIEVDNIISETDGYVFIEKGQRCAECGEEFIHEKDAQHTIEIAKKLGVWPQPPKLHRSLSKSGRGFVLRIPSDIEKDFKLKAGESIDCIQSSYDDRRELLCYHNASS